MNKQIKATSSYDPNVYPPGWNYRRAKAVADYYDARKDQAVFDVTRVSNPCERFSDLRIHPTVSRQHGLKSRVTKKRN